MQDKFVNESMLDLFIFECSQLIEQLEQSILSNEKSSCYSQDAINEVFRIMHTIKGSSAMMMFNGISTLAHSIEDLFYYLRENKPDNVYYSALSDLVLEGLDFIKGDVEKIKSGGSADSSAIELIEKNKAFLYALKNGIGSAGSVQSTSAPTIAPEKPHDEEKPQNNMCQKKEDASAASQLNAFKAIVFFEDGCEMENIRSFTLIHNLKDFVEEIYHIPQDVVNNEASIDIIRQNGFKVYLKTACSYERLNELFLQTIFLSKLELVQLENDEDFKQFYGVKESETQGQPVGIAPQIQSSGKSVTADKEAHSASTQQNIISVSVSKLDKLMDLVGEMVISEAMVIQNPDLKGLQLNNFMKAAQQLHKITSEMQDIVMSIRMVPLSATFLKMHRVVRDMSKKLDKEIVLKIVGEETEVDKNVIEHISDPLMHIVRNAADHGIESPDERETVGKPKQGTITLEAKNSGSDVLIIIKDDGKGLDKEKILKRARENGLLYKPEAEMTDNEIFNLIFLPGFSTKENVTEFSGRGVGMDVVIKNIETIGGSVSVDSITGKGSAITLKIPLTLAIIDGMNIKVGSSYYTIPTISIRESFVPKESDVFIDPDGNEMIMVRGACYPILRLHSILNMNTQVMNFYEGIFIMIEHNDKTICIFADKLIGQQQVVVKALPEYVGRLKKTNGIAGCTLLGDGSISLILDIEKLGR